MASNTPPKTPKPTPLRFGVAACSVAINTAGEIQLVPSGDFRGVDGRPKDAPSWVMDAQGAADVMAFCSARQNDIVIDYEHQTLHTDKNGQPAPAAGWFSGAALRWEEGVGLFAKSRWTARAQGYIDNDEYKYISPVILYEKGTGRVKGIISAALTNNACIDGMDDVLCRAAASFLLDESISQEDLSMDIDEFLDSLRWMLNLPTLAPKEEVLAELQKAVTAIKASAPEAVAAAGFSVVGLVDSLGSQVAALKAAVPDPSQFAPVNAMQAMQVELAALKASSTGREVGEIVTAALKSTQLLPAQEKWATDLGMSNIAQLREYVKSAPAIAALTSSQTDGKPPVDGVNAESLSDLQMATCKALSVDPKDYAANLATSA